MVPVAVSAYIAGTDDLKITPDELGEALNELIPNMRLAYLFGSFADGSAHKTSDVDLAFLSATKIEPLERYNAAQILAGKINRDVDLVDLFQAGEEIRKEAVTRGCLILGDQDAADAFELRIIRDYQDYRYRFRDQIEALLRP